MGLFDSLFGATTNKTKTSSTSEVKLPAWLESASQGVAGQVGQIGQTPFQGYDPNARVAGMTPDQIAAQGQIRDMQGSAAQGASSILGAANTAAPQITNPYTAPQFSSDYAPGQYTTASTQAPQYDPSGNSLSTMNPFASTETGPAQFTSGYTTPAYSGPTRLIDNIPGAAGGPEGSVNDYMNPYVSQVVANALADLERSSAIGRQGIDAKANMAGAFGDSGHALELSEQRANTMREAGRLASSGYADAFNNAMGLREADLGRGLDIFKTNASLSEAGANRALETFKTNLASNTDFQNRMLQQFTANAGLSQSQASQAMEAFKANAGATADWENRLLDVFKTNMGLNEAQANRTLDIFKTNAGLSQQAAGMDIDTQKSNAALTVDQLERQMRAPGMAQDLQTGATNLLSQSGAQQQAIAQAQANAQYEEFLRQTGFPAEQAKQMAAILAQLPAGQTTSGTSTQKTPGPSVFGQILGGIAPIAGAALGGPIGGAMASSLFGGAAGGGMPVSGSTGATLPGGITIPTGF